MAAPSPPLSLLFLSLLPLALLLNQPFFSIAKPHRLRPEFLFEPTQTQTQTHQNDDPTRFFEVTKPIKTTTKPCSHLALSHDFGFTYGKPPVVAKYRFPSDCRTDSSEFSKIVLEWTATCKGRQFDRIFGVWLDGVELLRSCTAEPRATGIVWTVEKDVTRYHSLLVDQTKTTRDLSVYLGNIVDTTYTGVYHVNLTFHFYPSQKATQRINSRADLVLPVSRNPPLNDGLWFQIQNSTDSAIKEVTIPRNAYKAVLEVYVSFHENDEFWYGNPPNDYISANNLTGSPGNGPFREVVVSLDGDIAGAIWPFTVIFTGGINPLLWRPISAIGSFDLPTYDIEITPFLGKILDGKSHKIAFNVKNALNVWYVDANLHLWLDSRSKKTQGKLTVLVALPLDISVHSNFTGLEGTFFTRAGRSFSSSGWVNSSFGNMTTRFNQDLRFTNTMVMGNDGNMQSVDQVVNFNDSVCGRDSRSSRSNKRFVLKMYSSVVEQGNETRTEFSNVTLGFDETKIRHSLKGGFLTSKLTNLQSGEGDIVVKGRLVQSGLGSTQQVYEYVGPEMCYFRNISSSNYTVLHDDVSEKCGEKKRKNRRVFGAPRLWPFRAKKGFSGV